ncbi:hypothetical protein [Burkholderia stagnalis]|uniref:hypothetical protein n=1 Tax=Burkholderia stagnalis TaxID=1503054 RepID=UPI0007577172|nr:hypothetical protein [Burkholderia stagnalis]KVL84161.1 hypothetical protein WT03_02355 [Burkholderia stagnalis]KVL98385.1 hypothetical protein WT02_10125 [Burkholderia stagnalis]KVM16676.1 hypothetical protein WT04_03105 [Burkholderia stagnalis]
MNTEWFMKLKWVTRDELAAMYPSRQFASASLDDIESVAVPRRDRTCLSCGAREAGGVLPCGH